jgi:hypothetical protein
MEAPGSTRQGRLQRQRDLRHTSKQAALLD